MRFHSLLFDPTAIGGFEERSHFLTDLKASQNTKSELAYS
jgi:hypothetical protein